MQMCASFKVIRTTIQLQYYDVDVTRLKIRGDGMTQIYGEDQHGCMDDLIPVNSNSEFHVSHHSEFSHYSVRFCFVPSSHLFCINGSLFHLIITRQLTTEKW
ncbi:unnamed protein product [Schistosoma mansoni]|uniref:Smp_205650 n=1 Tax=Schistosoma mansoni TaxID=6183 RepID=UPI00022C85A2|nr:unnamed protein product [Schistosoma mansoni]|eukprot:XP_018644758.1 unnamed protein product [Schistosoma mansoni]